MCGFQLLLVHLINFITQNYQQVDAVIGTGYAKTTNVSLKVWLESEQFQIPKNVNSLIECANYCARLKNFDESNNCNAFTYQPQECNVTVLPFVEEFQENVELKVKCFKMKVIF
jgi:hypothetical protein